MKRLHGRFVLFIALFVGPVALANSGDSGAAASAAELAQKKADNKKATTPADPAASHPATIQGKTIDDWLAALKDRDPDARERAVEALGTRAVDPAATPDEKLRIQTATMSLALSEKNAEVRQAAAFLADLIRASRSPEMVNRLMEQRKRTVKPTRTQIRLVDVQGRPVEGAIAGTYFQRDADKEPHFRVPERGEAATSDAQGALALRLSIPSHLNGAGIYAIRQDSDLPIVGLKSVSREEIRDGKPVTIVMHPACRVRMRVESPGLRELFAKYHADPGPNWWSAAYVWLGEDHQSPRPLFTHSTTGQLEFLLPPGRYRIMAYGDETFNTEQTIDVKPGHRLLNLGVVEVSPNNAIKEGIFRGFWRSVHRDPRAAESGLGDEKRIKFRRPRLGTALAGEARQVQDVAYSPDGTLLATAHWYESEPGEVKLWDTKTGKLGASLPVTVKEGGVLALRFSPDGKIVAGSVGVLPNPKPPGVVVLWDVAGRRELKTLHGHSARITALAFAPDGRSLASGGEDRTVRFWDVATGREIGRTPANPGWVRSLAYSPDGKVLAIGSGATVKLWNVAENGFGATLEPNGFAVQSLAFAPDGRALAAAGTAIGAGNQGQVRLFDFGQSPPTRKAELSVHREAQNRPADWMSDVAFTADGRRVAAIAMQTIVIWDAATGDEQESLDRQSGSSADRLAVSPDGRWLAVSGVGWAGVRIFDISPLER